MGTFIKYPAHRWLGLVGLAAVPTIAFANGAMGLGLERWHLTYWFVYVFATIVAEAWLIGRCSGLSWRSSLGLSAIANGATAGCCGAMGLISPLLHSSLWGSKIDPNPLMDAVTVLFSFAIPSALFEYLVWGFRNPQVKFWRVVWVHFAVVPLALVILLIPERPYLGVEAFTSYHRLMVLRQTLKPLRAYMAEHHRVPTGNTPEKLAAELRPYLDRDQDFAAAFYKPVYTRFATVDDRRYPFELNRAILGAKVSEKDEDANWVWLIRPPASTNNMQQIEVDTIHGEVRFSWPEGSTRRL